MTEPRIVEALEAAAAALRRQQQRFALVGGLAVSIRGEVRFTRDVDLAVAVANDQEAEHLTSALGREGYRPVTSVEHETRDRLSTVRLLSSLNIDPLDDGPSPPRSHRRSLPDLEHVRANLALIRQRGYDRGEALDTKLDVLLAEVQ